MNKVKYTPRKPKFISGADINSFQSKRSITLNNTAEIGLDFVDIYLLFDAWGRSRIAFMMELGSDVRLNPSTMYNRTANIASCQKKEVSIFCYDGDNINLLHTRINNEFNDNTETRITFAKESPLDSLTIIEDEVRQIYEYININSTLRFNIVHSFVDQKRYIRRGDIMLGAKNITKIDNHFNIVTRFSEINMMKHILYRYKLVEYMKSLQDPMTDYAKRRLIELLTFCCKV